MSCYLGTKVEVIEGISGKQFLDGAFIATQGLVMSQINEMTGLLTPTVQNWVSRGFLSRPINKRYNENQTARILIVNALRDAMSLSDILQLLVYLNGSPDDRNDDIIEEAELYGYICEIVSMPRFSYIEIDRAIESVTASYVERGNGTREKLRLALKIICIKYLACQLIEESDALIKYIK